MTTVRARAGAALLLAATVAVALVVVVTSAGARNNVISDRIAGSTRFETAELIATTPRDAHPNEISSTTSTLPPAFGSPGRGVLVSGEDFPDAVSAAYLAGQYQSPVLLTHHDTLSTEALKAFKDLGIVAVTIVGGPSAVATSEEDTLRANNITPSRVAGDTRDATAAAVASVPGEDIGSFNGAGRTALLAADTADHVTDALTAGPISWVGHFPILLTSPGALSQPARDALGFQQIKHVIILGGTGAVSAAVESADQSLGITTERIQGPDREATAIAAANVESQSLGFSFGHVFLATGLSFPDALAGGPLAGVLKSPILLTQDTNDLGAETQAFFPAHDRDIGHVTAFGGTAVVSDQALNQARTSAVCASDTTTTAAPGLLDPILKLLGGGGSSGPTTTLPPCTQSASATSGAPGTTATPAASTTTTTTASGGAPSAAVPIPGGLPIPAPAGLPVSIPSGFSLPGLATVSITFDPTNPLAPLCLSVQVNEKTSRQQLGPLPVCVPI